MLKSQPPLGSSQSFTDRFQVLRPAHVQNQQYLPSDFSFLFCFVFFFALNAESSCLLSQLLCLLSSFLLNIVSVGVMETHFFHCNDFWGLLLVRVGWGRRQ